MAAPGDFIIMPKQNLLSDNDMSNLSAEIWNCIRNEASKEAQSEPILASFLHTTILNHENFASALAFHLSNLLSSATASALPLREVIDESFENDSDIIDAAVIDVAAIRDRDSACGECGTPFLYYKGFHALQSYRVAHWLWQQERVELALFLQSRISNCFGVDIHPAAKIGYGLMLDHATGIVIGETSVVGNNVSIMQSVTLGGTGKDMRDRHPKIGDGVLIGAGSKILGNINIGEGAQVCAGSVVLSDVPSHSAVAGVPAQVVGKPNEDMPSLYMNQQLN
jgi:serine O-acetyltransferase